MESRSAWVQQHRSGISFDELSSMVAELVTWFESEHRAAAPANAADWQSPSARTRVVRNGSSASLHSLLNQVPDAVAAEYYVLYLGTRVFTWREYLWPHLNSSDANRFADGMVYLPEDCLNELMDFHVRNDTPWLRRFRNQPRHHRQSPVYEAAPDSSGVAGAIQINEVRVVAQAN